MLNVFSLLLIIFVKFTLTNNLEKYVLKKVDKKYLSLELSFKKSQNHSLETRGIKTIPRLFNRS